MEGRQEGIEKRGPEPTLEILNEGTCQILEEEQVSFDLAFLSTLFLPDQAPQITWQWVGEPDLQPLPGHQLQLLLPLDLVQSQVDD